jgi:Leucine-rich repeat (LRR) protein
VETESLSKSGNKKPFRLKLIISAAVLLLIVITVFVFILIEQNKPDPFSVEVIHKAVARQLNKSLNEISEADYAEITELCIAQKTMQQQIAGHGPSEIYSQGELADLKLFKKFVNLEYLDISYLSYPQKKLPNWLSLLAKLGIYNVSNKTSIDLEPLQDIPKLQKLKIRRTPFNNIESLANLTELEGLDLQGVPISDINWLSSLTKLELLNLGATDINSIEPLRELKNLRELIFHLTNISDIEPVRGMKNLRKLSIDGTLVSDFEPLRELTNLQELYISNTPVWNLEPITGLPSLKFLRMQICKNISEEQVQELQEAMPDLVIDRAMRQ